MFGVCEKNYGIEYGVRRNDYGIDFGVRHNHYRSRSGAVVRLASYTGAQVYWPWLLRLLLTDLCICSTSPTSFNAPITVTPINALPHATAERASGENSTEI